MITTWQQLIEVIERAFMEDAGEYLEDTYDAIATAILERWPCLCHEHNPYTLEGKCASCGEKANSKYKSNLPYSDKEAL